MLFVVIKKEIRYPIKISPIDKKIEGIFGVSSDEGSEQDKLASVALVNVIVTDVNDNPPRFLHPNYKFQLGSLDATEIGRVTASDDDLGTGGEVKFRLLEQTEVRGVADVIIRILFY